MPDGWTKVIDERVRIGSKMRQGDGNVKPEARILIKWKGRVRQGVQNKNNIYKTLVGPQL